MRGLSSVSCVNQLHVFKFACNYAKMIMNSACSRNLSDLSQLVCPWQLEFWNVPIQMHGGQWPFHAHFNGGHRNECCNNHCGQNTTKILLHVSKLQSSETKNLKCSILTKKFKFYEKFSIFYLTCRNGFLELISIQLDTKITYICKYDAWKGKT